MSIVPASHISENHKRVWQEMPSVGAIWEHPLFQVCYEKLCEAEADRAYCKHQISHLLDVARIAYIAVLERGIRFRKEVVYAAALLHDVGKAEQYLEGTPHEVVGAKIAWQILQDVEGYSELEKNVIMTAVAQHRHWADDASPLGKLLYEADKNSRACFACDQRETCNWPEDKMNLEIRI